ncbi:hypothetical protein N0V90_011192 [Kalmusia sp. IMI 367209]|nr:hypothetical protein N0V90_011192 [Kalmusia sp. IMI 367209]
MADTLINMAEVATQFAANHPLSVAYAWAAVVGTFAIPHYLSSAVYGTPNGNITAPGVHHNSNKMGPFNIYDQHFSNGSIIFPNDTDCTTCGKAEVLLGIVTNENTTAVAPSEPTSSTGPGKVNGSSKLNTTDHSPATNIADNLSKKTPNPPTRLYTLFDRIWTTILVGYNHLGVACSQVSRGLWEPTEVEFGKYWVKFHRFFSQPWQHVRLYCRRVHITFARDLWGPVRAYFRRVQVTFTRDLPKHVRAYFRRVRVTFTRDLPKPVRTYFGRVKVTFSKAPVGLKDFVVNTILRSGLIVFATILVSTFSPAFNHFNNQRQLLWIALIGFLIWSGRVLLFNVGGVYPTDTMMFILGDKAARYLFGHGILGYNVNTDVWPRIWGKIRWLFQERTRYIPEAGIVSVYLYYVHTSIFSNPALTCPTRPFRWLILFVATSSTAYSIVRTCVALYKRHKNQTIPVGREVYLLSSNLLLIGFVQNTIAYTGWRTCAQDYHIIIFTFFYLLPRLYTIGLIPSVDYVLPFPANVSQLQEVFFNLLEYPNKTLRATQRRSVGNFFIPWHIWLALFLTFTALFFGVSTAQCPAFYLLRWTGIVIIATVPAVIYILYLYFRDINEPELQDYMQFFYWPSLIGAMLMYTLWSAWEMCRQDVVLIIATALLWSLVGWTFKSVRADNMDLPGFPPRWKRLKKNANPILGDELVGRGGSAPPSANEPALTSGGGPAPLSGDGTAQLINRGVALPNDAGSSSFHTIAVPRSASIRSRGDEGTYPNDDGYPPRVIRVSCGGSLVITNGRFTIIDGDSPGHHNVQRDMSSGHDGTTGGSGAPGELWTTTINDGGSGPDGDDTSVAVEGTVLFPTHYPTEEVDERSPIQRPTVQPLRQHSSAVQKPSIQRPNVKQQSTQQAPRDTLELPQPDEEIHSTLDEPFVGKISEVLMKNLSGNPFSREITGPSMRCTLFKSRSKDEKPKEEEPKEEEPKEEEPKEEEPKEEEPEEEEPEEEEPEEEEPEHAKSEREKPEDDKHKGHKKDHNTKEPTSEHTIEMNDRITEGNIHEAIEQATQTPDQQRIEKAVAEESTTEQLGDEQLTKQSTEKVAQNTTQEQAPPSPMAKLYQQAIEQSIKKTEEITKQGTKHSTSYRIPEGQALDQNAPLQQQHLQPKTLLYQDEKQPGEDNEKVDPDDSNFSSESSEKIPIRGIDAQTRGEMPIPWMHESSKQVGVSFDSPQRPVIEPEMLESEKQNEKPNRPLDVLLLKEQRIEQKRMDQQQATTLPSTSQPHDDVQKASETKTSEGNPLDEENLARQLTNEAGPASQQTDEVPAVRGRKEEMKSPHDSSSVLDTDKQKGEADTGEANVEKTEASPSGTGGELPSLALESVSDEQLKNQEERKKQDELRQKEELKRKEEIKQQGELERQQLERQQDRKRQEEIKMQELEKQEELKRQEELMKDEEEIKRQEVMKKQASEKVHTKALDSKDDTTQERQHKMSFFSLKKDNALKKQAIAAESNPPDFTFDSSRYQEPEPAEAKQQVQATVQSQDQLQEQLSERADRHRETKVEVIGEQDKGEDQQQSESDQAQTHSELPEKGDRKDKTEEKPDESGDQRLMEPSFQHEERLEEQLLNAYQRRPVLESGQLQRKGQFEQQYEDSLHKVDQLKPEDKDKDTSTIPEGIDVGEGESGGGGDSSEEDDDDHGGDGAQEGRKPKRRRRGIPKHKKKHSSAVDSGTGPKQHSHPYQSQESQSYELHPQEQHAQDNRPGAEAKHEDENDTKSASKFLKTSNADANEQEGMRTSDASNGRHGQSTDGLDEKGGQEGEKKHRGRGREARRRRTEARAAARQNADQTQPNHEDNEIVDDGSEDKLWDSANKGKGKEATSQSAQPAHSSSLNSNISKSVYFEDQVRHMLSRPHDTFKTQSVTSANLQSLSDSKTELEPSSSRPSVLSTHPTTPDNRSLKDINPSYKDNSNMRNTSLDKLITYTEELKDAQLYHFYRKNTEGYIGQAVNNPNDQPITPIDPIPEVLIDSDESFRARHSNTQVPNTHVPVPAPRAERELSTSFFAQPPAAGEAGTSLVRRYDVPFEDLMLSSFLSRGTQSESGDDRHHAGGPESPGKAYGSDPGSIERERDSGDNDIDTVNNEEEGFDSGEQGDDKVGVYSSKG